MAATGAAGSALAARTVIIGAGALLGIRYIIGAAFAHYNCRIVFNRHPPRNLRALQKILGVVRPLGIAWRALTCTLRCRPNVYILGEVRCGTTTLASLLRGRLGMHGPFTPWVHPLAERKESFFFVGHYWGLVDPTFYRMCFPLRLTKLVYKLCRRTFVVFDGCASYLSAPWAPALVQRATPRPLLIVCLREPVSQHISWWRLEQASMAWAKSLGLEEEWVGEPGGRTWRQCGAQKCPCQCDTHDVYADLMIAPPSYCDFYARHVHLTPIAPLEDRMGYPPRSFADAIALSQSPRVSERWRLAEGLADGGNWPLILPAWALPFPNGQLSAFDRMGHYAETLAPWLARFPRECFLFVTLDELSEQPQAVLERVRRQCVALGIECAAVTSDTTRLDDAPRLNESPPLPPHLEPDEHTLRHLAKRYREPNQRLFDLIGRDLGWHDDERYPWYSCAKRLSFT